MVEKQKLKKVIAIFILIAIIIAKLNIVSVYGKTNSVYNSGANSGTIDVEKATSESTVLDAVAHFLYAISGFIENIVSKLISIFTGEEIFPWADRVIFNTMPFLDINFLSPEEGSLFLGKASASGASADTAFGNIIRNIYYTVFNLSVIFFGVVVGVMAIKLALSSIASDKAKYKHAIQNWLFALILLFTSHYLIAFIFFVNEKLVETASAVLLDQVEDIKVEFDADAFTDEQCKSLVYSLLDNASANGDGEVHSADRSVWLGYKYSRKKFIIYGPSITEDQAKNALTVMTYDDFFDSKIVNGATSLLDQDLMNKYTRNICYLLTNKYYMKYRGVYDYTTHSTFSNIAQEISNFFGSDSNNGIINHILKDAAYITAESVANDSTLTESKFVANVLGISESDYNAMKAANPKGFEISLFGAVISSPDKPAIATAYVYNEKISNIQAANSNKDVFTGMSNFFRDQIYTFKTDKSGLFTSSTPTEFSPIPAILYAIFVIQSIMYFIAYLRRFFYIIILAMFAPIVILYDFLTKTTMS